MGDRRASDNAMGDANAGAASDDLSVTPPEAWRFGRATDFPTSSVLSADVLTCTIGIEAEVLNEACSVLWC